MINIIKRRKNINGVNITLLEKSVPQIIEPNEKNQYLSLENRIKTYVDDKLKNVQGYQLKNETIISNNDQLQNSIPNSIQYTLTKDELLGIPTNTPEDGSVLSYDSQTEDLIWRQSPNVRFDLIDNKINQYRFNFTSDLITSNKLYIPFAVRSPITGEVWGGNGKGGLFWGDPWLTPVDNYSIKVGKDDETIGETGYTYLAGSVGTSDGAVVMKFTNGSEGSRGFVWASQTPSGSKPVMSLDTNDPDSIAQGGNLTVKHNITSEKGNIIIGNSGETYIGLIHFPTYDISDGFPLFTIETSSSLYDDYALVYESGFPYGKIKLKQQVGSGSSSYYSTSGGIIDCGSFLSTDGMIDCGSFI